MEKQFSITFDLSKIEVLIPSGRLMNLKQSLNWDEIDCSKEDLNQLSQYVTAQTFKVNTDFVDKGQSFVNQIMNGKSHKENRRQTYTERGISYVINPKNFSNIPDKLAEELKGELAELFEETKLNSEVSKKMLKLAQLKLMNN